MGSSVAMRSPGGRGFFRSVALAFAASAAAAAAAAARHATAAAVVDAMKMKDWHEFLCMQIIRCGVTSGASPSPLAHKSGLHSLSQ